MDENRIPHAGQTEYNSFYNAKEEPQAKEKEIIVEDHSPVKKMSFGEAFKIARQSGAKTFKWTDKDGKEGLFTTQLREEVKPMGNSHISSSFLPKENTNLQQENVSTGRFPVVPNLQQTAISDASRPRIEGPGAYSNMASDVLEMASTMLPAPAIKASKFLNYIKPKYLPEVFNMGEGLAKDVVNTKVFNPVITELKQKLVNARSRSSIIKLMKKLKDAEEAQKLVSEIGSFPKGLNF